MAHRTDRDAEFSAFLAADSAALSGAARQVAGADTDAAAELLQTALVKTYVAWPQVGPDGALAHARALIGAPDADGSPDSGAGPADVPLDVAQVLAEGHNAVRGRRMGWTVVGLAALAVVASVVTPVLIAGTVPPTPVPVATPSTTPTAAATPSADNDAPSAPLIGTTWQVAGFEGVLFAPSRTMTIRLHGGTARGFSGCNTFRARYTLTGGRLRFTRVVAGTATCSGRAGREETAFLAALSQVRSYRTGLGGLVLDGADGSPTIALVPFTADAATWRLADLAGTARTDSNITLVVAGDHLRGDTGCGGYAADLVRDGDAWTVSNTQVTTAVRCPRAASRRATRYLDLLKQVDRAELGIVSLTLTGPDGTLSFAVGR